MSDIDLIIERLEMRGHRVTESRRRVLAAVLAQSAHFTVDDVLHSVRKVGRATVFRTIKLLLDLNILCRILLDDGALHYRVSTRGHHHHLVCRDCGRVEDFTRCDVPALVRELARATDYEIEGHWLEVYGRCQACRLLAQEPARAR
ncbi:MAG: Fur family transcriptional regulator [Gemmatimonadaceae bacterium]